MYYMKQFNIQTEVGCSNKIRTLIWSLSNSARNWFRYQIWKAVSHMRDSTVFSHVYFQSSMRNLYFPTRTSSICVLRFAKKKLLRKPLGPQLWSSHDVKKFPKTKTVWIFFSIDLAKLLIRTLLYDWNSHYSKASSQSYALALTGF